MRVFVGGATGYIGTAIVKALVGRGHEVIGSARNDDAARKLAATGATAVRADLSDAASFGRAAKDADAVIQAASTSDARSADYEPKAARAILDALAGSEKPFILTGGVWVYGSQRDATEASKLDPLPMVGWREASERQVLDAKGVRGCVVRPGVVHGYGGGIPAMWVASAKEHKQVRVPGDGKSHWAPVHLDDLAELYALVLENGVAGAVYNGVANDSPTTGEIGRAIAERHGAELVLWPLDEARKAMGPFADALALDQIVRSPRSNALGWTPKRPTLLDELTTGSYG